MPEPAPVTTATLPEVIMRDFGCGCFDKPSVFWSSGVMEIIRNDERPTTRGNADYFTGTVWMDPIVAAVPPPARLRALRVSFEPGARTAWHTHPRGQVLHIVSGSGRVQCAGGAVLKVNPGDTVLIKPGERHWHGAAPGHAMSHIAIHEVDDAGQAVTWLEKVTDAEYGA